MIRPDGFCYVEPRGAPTDVVDDELTVAARKLFDSCERSEYGYRGVHGCTGKGCKSVSDNRDYTTPDGRITHSLLVHYVSQHRSEVPAEDLAYLETLIDR